MYYIGRPGCIVQMAGFRANDDVVGSIFLEQVRSLCPDGVLEYDPERAEYAERLLAPCTTEEDHIYDPAR